MSAIAALFDRGAGDHGDTIGRMIAAMAHRGPDGVAFHHAGTAALGHALLRTARAGLHVAPDGSAISFDGRLDDRTSLAARLGVDPHADDAVLALAAYRRWGSGGAAHLIGDFAYALWDAPARRLVCTRDKFGVRPLLWCETPQRFLVASEGKALLAAGAPDAEDEAFVADCLAGLPPSAASTAYRAIRRLPPAHSLIVGVQGVRIERYWALPLPDQSPRGAAPEAFRAALTEAVRCRMESTQPVGTLLSGGLDSSSITCLAAAANGGAKLHTYSLVYGGTPEHDERRFMDAVLAHIPAVPTFIDAQQLDPFAAFGSLLATHEGPVPAPNIANIRLLHQRAAAGGTRVLLDGHGGDEVVSFGMGRLTELADAGQWPMLWRELHALHRADGGSALAAFVALLRARGPAQRLRGRVSRLLGRQAPIPPARPAFLDPAFAARMRLAERHAAPHRSLPGARRSREAVQQHAVLTHDLQPLALELHDRSAAAAGIEVRFPFWDERVIAVALAADPADKLADGWTRRLLRTAMAGILPSAIQWRRDKLDFTPHLLRHLIDDDAGEAVSRILFAKPSPLDGLADLPALRAALARLAAAHAARKACDGADLQGVWRAVMVGLWREQAHAAVPAWQEAAE